MRDPFGLDVAVYDAERFIADMIRERMKGSVSFQLVRDVVVGYFRRADRDLLKLSKMCKVLGMRDELQTYLEVLA